MAHTNIDTSTPSTSSLNDLLQGILDNTNKYDTTYHHQYKYEKYENNIFYIYQKIYFTHHGGNTKKDCVEPLFLLIPYDRALSNPRRNWEIIFDYKDNKGNENKYIVFRLFTFKGIVYHSSDKTNLSKISNEGLKPKEGTKYIFTTPSFATATTYPRDVKYDTNNDICPDEKKVIFSIDIPEQTVLIWNGDFIGNSNLLDKIFDLIPKDLNISMIAYSTIGFHSEHSDFLYLFDVPYKFSLNGEGLSMGIGLNYTCSYKFYTSRIPVSINFHFDVFVHKSSKIETKNYHFINPVNANSTLGYCERLSQFLQNLKSQFSKLIFGA